MQTRAASPDPIPPPPHSHSRAALLLTISAVLQQELRDPSGQPLLCDARAVGLADRIITRTAALGLECVAEGCWEDPDGPVWTHLGGGLPS